MLSLDMALKADGPDPPTVDLFGRAKLFCWQSEEGVLQDYSVVVSMGRQGVRVYLVPVGENMKVLLEWGQVVGRTALRAHVLPL